MAQRPASAMSGHTSSANPFSVQTNISAQVSAEPIQNTLLSPTQSALHPLPPRPLGYASSTVATPSNLTQPSTPVANATPRIRGGFEVDDDPEDEANGDDKDDIDVYDPAVGLDFEPPTSASNGAQPFDSNAQSPKQENGITPFPVQATDSPTEVLSYALPSTDIATRASTVTPAQVVDTQVQASPPRSNVNGSFAPAVPKARLAHDVVGILEDRIKEDPRGDIVAWLELINELKSRNKQDDVRQTYDRFLEQFPLSVCL